VHYPVRSEKQREILYNRMMQHMRGARQQYLQEVLPISEREIRSSLGVVLRSQQSAMRPAGLNYAFWRQNENILTTDSSSMSESSSFSSCDMVS